MVILKTMNYPSVKFCRCRQCQVR